MRFVNALNAPSTSPGSTMNPDRLSRTTRDILDLVQSKIGEGERRFGKRNFAELYAVFSTPRIITVQWSGRELGAVDGQFLSTLQENSERSAFVLGGRPWKVQSVDWRRGICAVEKMLFSNLLGGDIRLSQCRLDGHTCCTFEGS